MNNFDRSASLSIVRNDFNKIKIISPDNRTFEVLEEILLSEEIDIIYNMKASDVEKEFAYLGVDSKPSDKFLNHINYLKNEYIEPSICLEKNKYSLLEDIRKWLGEGYSLCNIPFVSKEILFKYVDQAYKKIFNYYRLDPNTSNISDLINKKLKNSTEQKNDTYTCGKTYLNVIVKKSLKELKKSYPEIKDDHEKILAPWLREIARLPIRREILKITTQLLSKNDSLANIVIKDVKPESVLYMILLFLHSKGMKVLYCNYIDNKSFKKLQIYCSNGEGKNYHFYKQEIAYKCLGLLKSDEYINKAFLIHISEPTIILPFILFCVRTKEQQIILIGMNKKNSDEKIKIMSEALNLSGFEISRETIFLEQKRVKSGIIEFENISFIRLENININDKTTPYIDCLVEKENLMNSNDNIEYINDMVSAMEITTKKECCMNKRA